MPTDESRGDELPAVRETEPIEPAESTLDPLSSRQIATQGQVATVQASFSGPLPPPEMLRAYNEAEPGLASRIIQMAETEAQHRREIERQESAAAIQIAVKDSDARLEEMRSDYLEGRWGQRFAASIGWLAILCSTYLGTHGAQATASIVGGGGLVAIVTAFLRSRKASEPLEAKPKPQQEEHGPQSG